MGSYHIVTGSYWGYTDALREYITARPCDCLCEASEV